MTDQARGPRTLRGALVSIPQTGGSPTVISFQYNPATLSRGLQPQMVGGEENDRSQAVRFTGAPVQTIQVEVEIDATDGLERNDPIALQYGIAPQLAALELLIYPLSSDVLQQQALLATGTIEVAPLTAPRTLFVWGPRLCVPVRLTAYSVSEEAFDSALNPIRAVVSLGMRVLTYSDLDSDTRDYHQFLVYQQSLEQLARIANTGRSSQPIGVDVSSL